MANIPASGVLNPTEDDIQKMLACQVHIGARNCDPSMETYVWKRRNDGVHIINLQKTWEKIVLAARIIVAVENPQDVCVISGERFGQRAVLKFGRYTGAQTIAGRWTPGTLTNQSQDKFTEPRILVLSDPYTDHQAITESSFVNIPTIAFCNTDTNLQNVDIAIPCNNKGKHAIGLMWWFLCREVLYLRNTPNMIRGQPWDVMVDLFLYRDPEEQEKEEAAQNEAPAAAPTEQQAVGNWTQENAPRQEEWGAAAAAQQWGAATAESWESKGWGQ